MQRIGVRELRQHASRYLERVKAGETVEVTERGQLVALLVPPAPAATARQRLVAAGRLIPGTRPFEVPRRVPAPSGAPDTAEALDELRRDRA
jgi:prevent-host-death family protein